MHEKEKNRSEIFVKKSFLYFFFIIAITTSNQNISLHLIHLIQNKKKNW